MGSIGWNSSNGGLAAVDSSIEEDRDHSTVVTTTIRAATAIVIRIMAAPLFGRDCAWCVKGSVEVIGCSPVADMRTQIERAALRRYFSLGKKVAIVRKTRFAGPVTSAGASSRAASARLAGAGGVMSMAATVGACAGGGNAPRDVLPDGPFLGAGEYLRNGGGLEISGNVQAGPQRERDARMYCGSA